MSNARPGARKGSPKKTTRKAAKTVPKKGARKPKTSVAVSDPFDAAAKSKDKAAKKGYGILTETQDDDKADAITKGIRQAGEIAKIGVKELKTTLDLMEQTTDNARDTHYLLELARRVAGQVTTALQEEITKAKKATKGANLKW